MLENKKPEDFNITPNSWTEIGLVNAVKWLFEKVEDQDREIKNLTKKLENK